MSVLTPRRILLAAVIAWLAVAILALVTGPPLGHDEAAFATAARGGAPPWLYRSIGVIWIGKIGVGLGGSEWALRIASVVLGASVVLATHLAGAALDVVPRGSDVSRTGAWAAAAIATAHPMVIRSAELIGDLPATACMIAGIAVLAGELSRDGGPRWRMALAAPAFAAAFYLRYGSAPLIALIGAAAALVWWRALLRRPLVALATAAAFCALLAPHVIQSLSATGKLLGILETSAAMPRRAYVGEGLVTYVTSNPFRFYGAIIAPLCVAGLVAVVRRPSRVAVFFAIVAIGQLVVLGLQSHAQPRYVFVATTLLVVLGVDLVLTAPKLARTGAALVALAWLGVAIAIVPYNRWLADKRAPLMAAAGAIERDAAGAPCVFVARVVTQLMWYTRCDGVLLRDPAALPPWPPALRRYVVSVPSASANVDDVLAVLPGSGVSLLDDRSKVWRVD